MKRLAPRVGLAFCLLGLVAGPARADHSVFLNGVRIDGVTNQTFRGCDVTIDAHGDVLISARGYQVERRDVKQSGDGPAGVRITAQVGPGSAAGAGAAATGGGAGSEGSAASGHLGRRYFLVAMQNRTGATQYDVDVFINGKLVRTVRSKDPQTLFEVTPYIFLGPNRVVMSARKNTAAGRISSSPSDVFRVILGEGSDKGGKVTVENPLVEFRRTADETQSFESQYEVRGR